MKKYILLLLLLSTVLFAEKKFKIWGGEDFSPDSKTVEKLNPKLSIWKPILGTIGSNILLGSTNKYIFQSDFAQISFDSIKENFKYGWGWDGDNFSTNMWGHPFQGSIYFNFARSAGYNYWNSLLFSALGSLQWEYFMEIEHPSINDLIMTTFQGAIFGEVFYRISSLMIDKARNVKLLRELSIFPFNPARSLVRFGSGRSFRDREYRLYELKPYKAGIFLGLNSHKNSDLYDKQKNRGYIALKYYYGDVFNQKVYNTMDMFKFNMEVQSKPTISITQFRIYGILYGYSTTFSKHNIVWGLFQYTDFLKNDIFQIGSVSFGPGIAYLTPKFLGFNRVTIKANFSFVPMSGVNSNYAINFVPDGFEEGRDYNLSTGFSLKLNFAWLFKYGILYADYSFWNLFTIQGANGIERVGILEPGISINMFKKLQIGLEFLFYHRNGLYNNLKDVYLDDIESRIHIGYVF